MAVTLSMSNIDFKKGAGPLQVTCFGNPDTAVGIKFFWYRDDPSSADRVEYHDEGSPFQITEADAGKCNQLRYIMIGKPLYDAKSLYAWVEFRQGASVTQQAYPYTLKDGETRYRVDDGVTVNFGQPS